VLDIACGNGNATLAAARSGAHAIGVDYVPALLEDGRARALAEGLDVEFRLGDAEDLPVDTGSVDAVLSVFGTMFAPDHQRTPDGFIGEMFRVISAHVPPPAGLQSPLLWGTEEHLIQLFGRSLERVTSEERTCTWRFGAPEEFVSFFRRWYGPTLKAFEALDEAGRAALTADLTNLARRYDRLGDGVSVAIPARYLESVIVLR
jgi:ubiquinone/menaquinone biosynthesis C-methylase UbiE